MLVFCMCINDRMRLKMSSAPEWPTSMVPGNTRPNTLSGNTNCSLQYTTLFQSFLVLSRMIHFPPPCCSPAVPSSHSLLIAACSVFQGTRWQTNPLVQLCAHVHEIPRCGGRFTSPFIFMSAKCVMAKAAVNEAISFGRCETVRTAGQTKLAYAMHVFKKTKRHVSLQQWILLPELGKMFWQLFKQR